MTTSIIEQENLQLLKEAALLYLDQTSLLDLLKQKCETYRHSKENTFSGIYSFTVDVNPSQISQVNASLTGVILHNPKLSKKIFQQVFFTAVQCLSLLPDDTKSSQVIVNLKITHLPPFDSYKIKPSDLPACHFDSRFYNFEGIVVSMTTPTEYSQVAKYRCPVTECHGATDNQYIRLHTAGAKETHTIRRDFHCVYCGSTLIEDVNCRVLGEKLVVDMVESKVLSNDINKTNLTCARYNQSMTVFIRDELMTNIQMGGHYMVIGIPIKQIMSNARVSASFETTSLMYSIYTSEMPSSVGDLYKGIHNGCLVPYGQESHLRLLVLCVKLVIESMLKVAGFIKVSSPWGFSASLAYLFGADVAPPGTYHKLKLVMLLSLVDTMEKKEKKGGKLNLLVTGRDTLVIDRLVRFGASFASRSVHHSAGLPLIAAVNKDGHGTGSCSIDGGSLLLAHQGICLLGDVARFKKDVIERLYHVMETGKVLVEIPKKYNDQSIQHMSMPINSSIWAYTDCQTSKCITDVFAPLEPSKSTVSLLEECFSLLLSCSSTDKLRDEYAEQCLIHHTLRQAVSEETELQESECVIDRKDFKQFFRHVSDMEVDLSLAATRLIKGYFVASRRVRSSGVHRTSFPQAALQTLSKLSKAHAKLSLRPEASEADAVLAIMLYEEMVTERFGYSVLSLQPRPHFRDDNIAAYIGPENDAYMQQFHTQLVRFCSCHAPDFDVFESES